ncbi:hypothetical protein D3C84_647050 [compost metagenome]
MRVTKLQLAFQALGVHFQAGASGIEQVQLHQFTATEPRYALDELPHQLSTVRQT